MAEPDASLARLIDRVRHALARGEPLDIHGGNTKSFYGEPRRGEPLDMTDLAGISSYEPTELVVTARAGTPLEELEAVLDERGQCLPFEPPRFSAGGTVGGMVAAGLSGPARAMVGSVRDHLLGVTLINGRGELLSFGGQVAKNVAGYDVSRLMAGSLGVLGVICEVSLKVLPISPATATLRFECDGKHALDQFNRWNSRPLPISASSWHDGGLHVRLAGARAAVTAACGALGGTVVAPDTAAQWWTGLRDHTAEFFRLSDADVARGESLWRLSVPPATAALDLPGRQFIEWHGAQRWCRVTAAPDATPWTAATPTPAPAPVPLSTAAPAPAAVPANKVSQMMREAAARVGGHATLFRGGDKSCGVFTPVSAALMRIHRGLKQSFDPAGVFNPGRLYADL
jgi:FAD/FMN-containing dehydrogenase